MRLWCKPGQEKLLDAMRDTFGAQPLRVPDARVDVLCVLASVGKDACYFRGDLAPLLEGDIRFPEYLRSSSDVSSVFSTRSSALDAKVGLKLLEGFASGFGLNEMMPAVEAQVHKGASIWVDFDRVERRFIDVGLVARRLGNARLLRNPATEPFLRATEPAQMLIVDSVLTSKSFTMGFGTEASENADVDLGPIQEVVGNLETKVSAKRTSDTALKFEGERALTFAFTCKTVEVRGDGSLESFDENTQPRFLSGSPEDKPVPSMVASLQGVTVGARDAMVDLRDSGPAEAGASARDQESD